MLYPMEFTPLGKAPPIGQAREDNILNKQFGDYFTDFDGKNLNVYYMLLYFVLISKT